VSYKVKRDDVKDDIKRDDKKKEVKMKKISKSQVKFFFFDLLMIIVGCSIGAFSTVGILIPNGLTSGGITGIVRILQNYVDIDFSIMYYIGSMLVLILCAITLGFREARKILLVSIIYPGIMMIFEHINIQLLEESDIILAAIYCGVFSGVCSGIILSRGYSFGGSDTIAKIIHKKILPHVPLSKVLLVLDASVIIASAFVYGRNIALYALVTTIIVSKTIDIYMFGLKTKIVQVEIISDEYQDIANYIMKDINRGISMETITGAYTKKERIRMMVLCSPRESIVIRNYIAQKDTEALITVIPVDTVWGNGTGFNKISEE